MSNFDFAVEKKDFASFAYLAVDAERLCKIDPSACIVKCRTCVEAATKWIYTVDRDLYGECRDRATFLELIQNYRFTKIVDSDILTAINKVRMAGNAEVHPDKKVKATEKDAICILYYLFKVLAGSKKPTRW